MWLSAALLLTVLTVCEVFILGPYDPPSTGRNNSLPTTQTSKRMPQNCGNYLISTY